MITTLFPLVPVPNTTDMEYMKQGSDDYKKATGTTGALTTENDKIMLVTP